MSCLMFPKLAVFENGMETTSELVSRIVRLALRVARSEFRKTVYVCVW